MVEEFHGSENFKRPYQIPCSITSRVNIIRQTLVSPSNTVGSRFTTGLRFRTFGCKSNRRKISIILNGL